MRDHRQRDRDADRRPGLEREADADPVHEAVAGERERGDHADLGMAVLGVVLLVHVVQQDELLQPVEQQEAGHQRDHRARGAGAGRLRQLEDLGQELERDHARAAPRR